ncbi:hypothetical protein [Cribrihabitans pelagius]|uniref:hypothetical protein n=1 Tax=Cribrihabitans pelagius TaxID=1765746 RepID=UPI003B58D941
METKLLIAVIGPTLGFFLWFGKRLFDDWRAARRARRDKRNLIRALYAEIDFNTRDMERFLAKSVSSEKLRATLEAYPKLIPHITDARHTEIYRTRIAEVHNVADGALFALVDFYGTLERIRVQVEGVNLPSYGTLTLEGRINAVEVIRRTAGTAQARGVSLLQRFERDFPDLGLHRQQPD